MGRYFIAAAPVQHIQPRIQASIFIQDLIFLVQDGLALWDGNAAKIIFGNADAWYDREKEKKVLSFELWTGDGLAV